jgi:streptomycin 3"-adenylyltransferase
VRPGVPAPFDRILPALVDDLRSTLGDELVGAYLYGSAVSGGFVAAVSDLDVVVVTASPVDVQPFDVFAGLVRRQQEREPDWAGRLDLVFVGRSTLATFRDGGGPFIEISHEDGPELKHRAEDWLETWYLALEADWPLIGPAPAELIPPISAREFLQAVADGIPWFISPTRNTGTDGWLAYRVLTLCRLLRSLESGALCSKPEGAAWAIDRYPASAPLIRSALRVRDTNGQAAFTAAEREAVPELLEFLAARVDAKELAVKP